MKKQKKYLLIVTALRGKGGSKNTFKIALRGGNEESLRKGLSSYLKKDSESIGNGNLKADTGFFKTEEIEKGIRTAIDNLELHSSSEKPYGNDYTNETKSVNPENGIKYPGSKDIIKNSMQGYEYGMHVIDVTDDPRLSFCKEVVVMSKDIEEESEDETSNEYPEIIYVKDAEAENDERITYDNGYHETICMATSEMEEYLLCWKRDMLKVEDCQ